MRQSFWDGGSISLLLKNLLPCARLGVGRYDISYRKRCIVYRIENIDMKEFHIVIVSKVSIYRTFDIKKFHIVIVSIFRYIVSKFDISLNIDIYRKFRYISIYIENKISIYIENIDISKIFDIYRIFDIKRYIAI